MILFVQIYCTVSKAGAYMQKLKSQLIGPGQSRLNFCPSAGQAPAAKPRRAAGGCGGTQGVGARLHPRKLLALRGPAAAPDVLPRPTHQGRGLQPLPPGNLTPYCTTVHLVLYIGSASISDTRCTTFQHLSKSLFVLQHCKHVNDQS